MKQYLIFLLIPIFIISSCRKAEQPNDPLEPNWSFEFIDVELGASKEIALYSGRKSHGTGGADVPTWFGTIDLPSNGILNTTVSGFSSSPYLEIAMCGEAVAEMGAYISVFSHHVDFVGDVGTIHSTIIPRDSLNVTSASVMLSTPTDGDLSLNETSGLWFHDASGLPTLNLPILGGFRYEVWIDQGGKQLKISDFRVQTPTTFDCTYCDAIAPGYNVPGMDLLVAPPNYSGDLPLPITDLSGAKISIVLAPDDITFRNNCEHVILEGEIPQNAMPNTPYQLTVPTENFFPNGTVIRREI